MRFVFHVCMSTFDGIIITDFRNYENELNLTERQKNVTYLKVFGMRRKIVKKDDAKV